MTTGELIKQYRTSEGLSQAALARLVGCKRSMMNLIESGDRSPSPALAGRLQAVTGIDARRLLGIFAEVAQ